MKANVGQMAYIALAKNMNFCFENIKQDVNP